MEKCFSEMGNAWQQELTLGYLKDTVEKKRLEINV
jgi:hypothetical protein